MRSLVRKVAFVGVPDRGVAESLHEHGYRVEAVGGESTVGLARTLYRLEPAVVHARKNHLKAALVATLLDLPLIVHAGREDLSPFTAYASKLAARTLCGGSAVREALVAQGARASTTCVLRSLSDVGSDLCDASNFPPMLDPAVSWVVSASPCDGPDRGHQDLLLAFVSVARTRPQLKLLVAGEGREAQALREQAEAAGMRGRVVVHAISLAHLPSVFARAAVVVGPTRAGNLPDPVPEALAVGAPVVATAVGAHPTWIREGRTGWLVPPRAPVALAARLAQVLDDAALARRVGASAREAALELAAPHAVAQELARSYSAVSRLPVHAQTGIYLPAQRSFSRA